MADPRMSQNAARLSEDIGDVLSAIRRMIADDDALSSARDNIRAERSSLIPDDAGEFLARRYGGNAALARQLVETTVRSAEPLAAETMPDAAAAPAIPQFILRAKPDLVPPAANVSPLRLGAERRVDEPEAAAPKASGWRAWLRPEGRDAAPEIQAQPQIPASPEPAGIVQALGDGADDADDFAEAFDWKARMRPELEEPAPVVLAEAKPAEQRLSGWALPPEPAFDPVAQLAAEAEAFAAEQQAQADLTDEEQSIRDLLREMVQEELNGELGERFSANLRAVIRREIAAAIDAHLDRL
ncbi:hypothetical protein PARHAE_00245 [Paracoccus haematequi]|uniref:DUF2497 domain-containing protein n=1 Tax=Paracoccus haematequi TaxID=2491866 RepID=A0A447IHW4_9RHOB|nr:hypothetical protein [Paracoccus haematequi]VDS07073.1 hypothetical protein PARHAE_00245 [Paracoccus haematequi]